MPNNYLLFAESWDLEPKCVEWLQRFLDGCREDPEAIPKEVAQVLEGTVGYDAAVEDAAITVNAMFSLNGPDGNLYVYAEESGDVELVGRVLYEMLKAAGSDQILALEWAETCSRGRPGEFGGGVLVVSREGTDYETTGEMRQRLERKIQRKRAKRNR